MASGYDNVIPRRPSHLEPDDPYEIQPARSPETSTPPTPGSGSDTTAPPSDFAYEPLDTSLTRHPVSEQDLLTRFPYMRWMMGVPELRTLLDQSYANGWSSEEFEGHLWQTSWWRTRSESARRWDEARDRDPGQIARRIQARRTYLTQQINQLGLAVSADELDALAEQSLRWDFTTEEIMAALGGDNTAQIGFGTIRETADRIIADARSYYMDFSQADALNMARRIETGDLSYDAVTSQMRQHARVNYRQFAGAIDDGLNLYEATAQLRQAVASTLEMSADAIDFRQPEWGELLQATDDRGNARVPTLGEATRWAQRQERYQTTQAAHRTASRALGAIHRTMGTSTVIR